MRRPAGNRLALPERVTGDPDSRKVFEDRISSGELSEITGLTASQIRQDLNHFGGFGQQGYGYNVNDLKAEIEKIIGINNSYKAIVIGLGNIGKAIFHYKGFQMSGMEVIGLFDRNPEIIGTTVQRRFAQRLPPYGD